MTPWPFYEVYNTYQKILREVRVLEARTTSR